MRSVGMLSPELPPGVPDWSPVARASAHAGACCFPCPQAGGPAAAGPRSFLFMRTWAGAAAPPPRKDAAGVRSLGNPSVARARTWTARLAGATSAVHVRSKGPDRREGWPRQRPRLSAVPTTSAKRVCQPPLCPLSFRGRFFLFRVENAALPGRSRLSDGPLVAFSVGHRWATRPTYPRNRCRSKGSVAHGERPQ